MFGISDYGAFVAAMIVFLLIPGPGNLALITSTSKGGVSGGMGATFGVIAGDQVLMWMAVAGVAALLAAYPAAFSAVQWAGAAYLAWLGARMVLAKPGSAPVLNIRPRHFFQQAFVGFFIAYGFQFTGLANSEFGGIGRVFERRFGFFFRCGDCRGRLRLFGFLITNRLNRRRRQRWSRRFGNGSDARNFVFSSRLRFDFGQRFEAETDFGSPQSEFVAVFQLVTLFA